jgi:hypothetical protein
VFCDPVFGIVCTLDEIIPIIITDKSEELVVVMRTVVHDEVVFVVSYSILRVSLIDDVKAPVSVGVWLECPQLFRTKSMLFCPDIIVVSAPLSESGSVVRLVEE